MDLAQAQIAVDQVAATFGGRFKKVMEWSKDHPEDDDLPYVSYATGLPKQEGDYAPPDAIFRSIDACVDAFQERMSALNVAPAGTLFWRHRPQIEVDDTYRNGKPKKHARYMVYCRMVWV